MRYGHTNLTVAMFFLVCGMSAGIVGCTKDPNSRDKDAKSNDAPAPDRAAKELDAREIAAKKLAAEELAAREFDAKELAAKELAAKELAGKEFVARDFAARVFAAQELAAPGPAAKELAATELTAVPLQEVKAKEKNKDKEPAKESAKEPAKDPKFEFKEPSEVGGKTFGEWVKQMKSLDPVKREEAMKNVTNFGPTKSHEALPEVIFQLNRHKSIPIDLAVRVNGIMALSTIYKQMAFIKKEPSDKLHKEAFAIYKMFLKDDQVIMRVRTVQGLPNLGPIARGAVEDVIKLTRDPITWEVRKEALQTLTWIAPDANGVPHAKVLPELRYALKDSAFIVRQTALEALAMLGAGKLPPELLKALDEDPSVHVRLTVLSLLQKLSKDMTKDDRPIAVKRLYSHLAVERDPILIMWTHATIMTLTEKVTKPHMDPIIDYISHTDTAVKVQALNLIGLGGKDAKPFAQKAVLDELEKYVAKPGPKMFEYPDISVGVAAMSAAVHIHAFEAVPILEKIETDRKAPEYLKIAAAKALDAFDDLKHHLDNKDKKDKDKDKKTPEKK